jgi:hypothetical protein
MKKRKSPEQTVKKPSVQSYKVQTKEEAVKKPSVKRLKVQTKEEAEEPKSEKIAQVERILDGLEIFPDVLHPLISGYWWNDNPFEKKWLVFERFCDGQFDKFYKDFQEETWSPATASEVMKSFITSLQIFEKQLCGSDMKKSNDSYYLLVELGKTLLGDEVVQKHIMHKLQNQVKKENTRYGAYGEDKKNLQAWFEGKYEINNRSLPSFLIKDRALIDTDPTTILLYYFLWRGYGSTSLLDYMAYQLGLFNGKKGFFWFLFIGLHGFWVSICGRDNCLQQQLGYSGEHAMEGAFPCENHANCWKIRFHKDS